MPGTESAAEQADVPFRLAENYFVKNTVKQLHNPKMETAEQFDAVFGMARTMSESSKPTAIDFSKEFVLAVILPETDTATSLKIQSVQQNEKGELVLRYERISGEKQSYTTMPFLAIIVDKANYRGIVVQEEQTKSRF
ncbi:MAG TPA: hypothetical protein VL092_03865 [Chitinophagaceae bacterium]|nr:hypothetical protein [Chitinophagaceae bacterium]